MLMLISYDVHTEDKAGKRRLRRIAKLCENWGQRVQFSVFECLVTPAQWAQLRHDLCQEMDKEQDSLRFYHLGSNWRDKIEHHGAKTSYDPEGSLIF